MDRNSCFGPSPVIFLVATREGGVDRNHLLAIKPFSVAAVATREGGVDRNTPAPLASFACGGSPPARVAWIEIHYMEGTMQARSVATREGGVDRNGRLMGDVVLNDTSPPARVAWIEIALFNRRAQHIHQSPPARVAWIEISAAMPTTKTSAGRHPRGWRG